MLLGFLLRKGFSLAIITNKLCGLDIDDEMDFKIVQSILTNNQQIINENT